MDSVGGFHLVEKDGELSQLVYHHPKYNPIPQTQSPTLSDEVASHDQSLQPLFFCPIARGLNHGYQRDGNLNFFLNSSPEYEPSIEVYHPSIEVDHPLLPLFWCNNKDFGVHGGCEVCGGLDFGTDYYFCETHDWMFHKECVESPLKIKHPYHPHHFLQLFHNSDVILECICCGRSARWLVYYCNICLVAMHPICAMKTIPFVIDPPKTHNHPLTLFPRQTSLTCDVCGLLRTKYPTYVCLRCNFVAHNDCMYSPRIIKISRHPHRVSYVSSLPSGEWSCGVCRQIIDGDYGVYTCGKCGDYAVHPRCALRKDVCDGEELEGVPEEDDLTQDAPPFDMIFEGVILHFLHDHHLKLEGITLYDENKLCQACVLPIFEGNFYSCMECDFSLHQECANSPRRMQHALHPHPLTLKDDREYDTLKAARIYDDDCFLCDICDRFFGGFVYQCPRRECTFDIDVRCASISEPFDYQGHEHPLFLSLDPEENPVCEVCKLECKKQLNCIKCDFIVCFKCATLPYKTRYKHDKHFLTVLWGEEVCEKDWCEACERNLRDTSTKLFYWCKYCCTTLHIACLFGEDPYLKPGQFLKVNGNEVQILRKCNLSRPFCDYCKDPCQGNIFTRDNRRACSIRCAQEIM